LDLIDVYNYIAYELLEPAIALSFINGLLERTHQLSIYGRAIAVSQREYIQRRYGPQARTITYKRMTIVFNVVDERVLIRRVMPGSMVL
jgi:hypothetical protein